MASSNLSCVICAEEFQDSKDLCSTVCGHIFHFNCLREWQKRSNTCPMCNQRDPKPHRLFLDLDNVSKSVANEDPDNEHKIVIKGVKSQLISSSLTSFVLDLAKKMGFSMRREDIKDVIKSDGNTYVTFFSVKHLDLFMENKNKLRGNQETSGIKINEVLDRKAEELFHYAHKLKQFGYKILFVKNKKIFAKINQSDAPLNIYSKDQVDKLCNDATPNECAENKSVNHKTKKGARENKTEQSVRSKPSVVTSKRKSESTHLRNSVRSYNTETKLSNNQNPNNRRRSNPSQNPSISLSARSASNNMKNISSNGVPNLTSREWRNPAFNSQTQRNTESRPSISSVRTFNEPTAPDISLMQGGADAINSPLFYTGPITVHGGTNFRQNSQSDWIPPRPLPQQSNESLTLKKVCASIFKKIFK